MPFVKANCTNCNGTLKVDSTKDAWICEYCGSPFIVDKAINNYNITNNNTIHANTVNIYGGNSEDFVIRGGVLIKYNGSSTSAVIPNIVTHIGANSFASCYGLKEVIIPNSVVEIGASAFSGCKNLQSINIPDSITKIERVAFIECSNLKSVNIPDSVKSIRYAFINCTSLQSVNIPDSVTDITYAFKGCTSLQSVNIPNSVTTINGAFENCTNLQSVNIPTRAIWNYDPFVGCPDTLIFEGESLFQLKGIRLLQNRIDEHRCIYCGGKLHWFFRKCNECGKYS